MIKTVIVNSEKQERDRISSFLANKDNIEVLAHGKDGYDAIKLIGSLKPDIAILDNNLDFIEGEEIPPLLKTRSPSTSVILLALGISDSQICRAAVNQVSGFVDKKTDMEILPEILKCITEGGSFISPVFATRILYLFSELNQKKIHVPATSQSRASPGIITVNSIISGKDPTGYLSKTELRILAKIGEGYTSKEIAKSLGLVVGTVRNYISSVMHKTGLRNRSEMVRYALKNGIIPLHI